jgi:RNA polymerase sigma-70 factor (ECF subfamily)
MMMDAPNEQRALDEPRPEPMTRTASERRFDKVYAAHAAAVWAFALHLARDRGEAEDLFQEAWLRAVEKMDGIDMTENVKAWLLTIVVNLHRDRLRRIKVRRGFLEGRTRPDLVVDEAGASGRGRDAALDLERAESGRAIRNAIGRLPESQRRIFILREVEGFSYEDACRILGLRQGTAKSLMFRAVRRLRRDLAPLGPANRLGSVKA